MSSHVAPYGVHLSEEIERLVPLVESLKNAKTTQEKIDVLDQEARIQAFPSDFSRRYMDEKIELVIKSVMAIGQYEIAFAVEGISEDEKKEKERLLLESLLQVEKFYEEIGGIVGYHLTLLQFLHKPKQRFLVEKSKYHAPKGVDLSIPSSHLDEMIYSSIEKMDQLAEMYPVGGAADRLRLHDPETGNPIPAAMLTFNGQTLLEKLIGDLQAREYLHFKVTGKQLVLPVAMMTSKEKDNHQQILSLCEKSHWFYRPKEKFSFFCQPLVPVVSREGNWIVPNCLTPLMKPGGHGVIWKLARDTGVIAWLKNQGVSKAIIRQINNPISSEDYHLMAFSGYGLKEDKRFGFASCQRQVKASEGINVLVEEEKEEGFSYTLTNIEYCDFSTYSIQDEPIGVGGRFSKFPSNTNLLFVDLSSIQEALETTPLPGMLVNVKKIAMPVRDGKFQEREVARLESTMQNVADYFQKISAVRLKEEEFSSLDSYITFNKRQKTISATKKEFSLGASLLETPEGCFLDVLANNRELLHDHCRMELPPLSSDVESFTKPSFLFHYHPALGPIYSIIGKKIRGGSLQEGSELRLHIAECDMENVSIKGSFQIYASNVMGSIDADGILQYGNDVGRCTLKNVVVENEGVDYRQENIFWKPVIYRKASCRIVLQGRAAFHAEDVTFSGDMEIVVEDGWKLTVSQKEGKLIYLREKMIKNTWEWEYLFNENKALEIRRKDLLP